MEAAQGRADRSILVWDTASAPNGSYVVKVVASDQKSNSAETRAARASAKAAASTSTTAPPAVTLGALAARRRHRSSCPSRFAMPTRRCTRVEYSLDAQRWQSAFPQDGILDGRQEQFALRLDAGDGGPDARRPRDRRDEQRRVGRGADQVGRVAQRPSYAGATRRVLERRCRESYELATASQPCQAARPSSPAAGL